MVIQDEQKLLRRRYKNRQKEETYECATAPGDPISLASSGLKPELTQPSCLTISRSDSWAF